MSSSSAPTHAPPTLNRSLGKVVRNTTQRVSLKGEGLAILGTAREF